jgi:phosphoribosylformylglycinamidine synthase subunit PurL
VLHGRVAGRPPVLDLQREKALITLLTRAAAGRLLQSAHDCSDGGLAVALAESAFDTDGIGAAIELAADGRRPDAVLFGESASRVLVSATQATLATVLQLAAEHHVPARVVGTTGGQRIRNELDGETALDSDLGAAYNTWSTALERFFAGRAA